MNSPDHLFRLEPAPSQRDSELVRVAMRTDVEWGRPVFRAPALPTAHQFSSEVPFSVNFCLKTRAAR